MAKFLKVIIPLLILGVAVSGFMWLRATRPMPQAAPVEEISRRVSVTRAVLGANQPVMELYGTIVARRSAEITSRVDGRIIEIAPNLVEGGFVREGELLLKTDPFRYALQVRELEAEIRQARARLAELESQKASERDLLEVTRARLELVRREAERRETLRGSEFTSAASLDEAILAVKAEETSVRLREQELTAMDARIDQQDAQIMMLEAKLARAERDLADGTMFAPFDAFVSEVEVAFGRELRANDTIARLESAAGLEVRFALSDQTFGQLVEAGIVGRPVEIVWQLGGRAITIKGEVVRQASRIEAASGSVELFAALAIDGPDHPIRPGAFVTVRLGGEIHEDSLRIAESALFHGDTVYAVVDGRADPRPVDLLARENGTVILRGEIQPGEPIVTSRIAEIGPGLRLEILREDAAAGGRDDPPATTPEGAGAALALEPDASEVIR